MHAIRRPALALFALGFCCAVAQSRRRSHDSCDGRRRLGWPHRGPERRRLQLGLRSGARTERRAGHEDLPRDARGRGDRSSPMDSTVLRAVSGAPTVRSTSRTSAATSSRASVMARVETFRHRRAAEPCGHRPEEGRQLSRCQLRQRFDSARAPGRQHRALRAELASGLPERHHARRRRQRLRRQLHERQTS